MKKPAKKRKSHVAAKDVVPVGGYQGRTKVGTFGKLNRIWQLRGRAGLKPVFSPEELWKAFEEFAEWCEKNPMSSTKTTKQGMKKVMKTTERHIIPYTREGFRLYIDKSKNYLNELRKRGSDFVDVLDRIDDAIAMKVINGGMAGKFHGNLAARYINLEDNVVVEDKRKTISELFPSADEFALAEKKINDER